MRVLVEWEPIRLYERLIPNPADRNAFFSRTKILDVNADATRDGDLMGKIHALAEAYPEDAHLILPWWTAWTEMCHAPIQEVGELLIALKATGVPVCGFSNFSDDALAIAAHRYPVLREFDAEVISCRCGSVKPEPGIYERVEQKTGVSGPDLFFIDDKQENTQTASMRGWRTHVFDGWSGLAAALPGVGLGAFAKAARQTV